MLFQQSIPPWRGKEPLGGIEQLIRVAKLMHGHILPKCRQADFSRAVEKYMISIGRLELGHRLDNARCVFFYATVPTLHERADIDGDVHMVTLVSISPL